MKRKVAFWCLVVLAAVMFTNPILSIQDILGYNGFGTSTTYPNSWIKQDLFIFHNYALKFYDPRLSVVSCMLVAVIIGLGAIAGTAMKLYDDDRPVRVVSGAFLAVVTAAAFRGTEVLVDTLMFHGICAGSREACPENTAIKFLEGDRFTVIAYLALGVAIVIGGMLAKKGWHRFVVPPPAPVAIIATEPALNAATEEDTIRRPDSIFCEQTS